MTAAPALHVLRGEELDDLPMPDDPDLESIAIEAAENDDTPSSGSWRNRTPAERVAAVDAAATFRRNLATREAELSRPLTLDEQRLLEEIDRVRQEREHGPGIYELPEDRGLAQLSELGTVEYVEDLVRPGRIVVVAAEEGTGKSYAISGELGIRLASAGGSFAGTWPVVAQGPVLVLSEMHQDDDYLRESQILEALELTRDDLVGRYWRLPLFTAAADQPALLADAWLAWITAWLRTRGALLLIVDTATGASQVDPWGKDIQGVYRRLRTILADYPALAIVLIVHLKKPQGSGERRLSDVLGEWGRWCDVVLLLEHDGPRTKLSTRKRIRRERRIVATKAGGLLVDPVDLDEATGSKVPADAVLAAIAGDPGVSYAKLAAAIGVGKATATRYVKALGDQVDAVATGPRGEIRLFVTASPPHTASRADDAVSDAVATTDGIADRLTASPLYIGEAVSDAVVRSDGAVADDPVSTPWCSDYRGHYQAHRDLEAEPWCATCIEAVL
ncbi:MAG: hypothetical protein EPO00_07570 [Chloroflexota bacterium]|nr:MAG: hypothetical protein EPO00_07570 [Chloroflexota bacterium]